MSKWIDISESLPDFGQPVIIIQHNATMEVARCHKTAIELKCTPWDYEHEWLSLDGRCKFHGVTHWRLLPKPPKIKRNGGSTQACILAKAICQRNSSIADKVGLILSSNELHYIYESIGQYYVSLLDEWQ